MVASKILFFTPINLISLDYKRKQIVHVFSLSLDYKDKIMTSVTIVTIVLASCISIMLIPGILSS